MAQLKNTTVNDSGFLQLPVGTTGQRPTPAGGQMRFNSTTGKAEFYNGSVGGWLGTAGAGVVATGGTVYDVDTEGTTYRVHVFTSTGNSTFTVTQGGSVEYLIVAGGGGGGSRRGGGGGAGGLLTGTVNVTPQPYTIAVGTGGLGLVTNTSDGIIQQRSDGGNSSAFGLTVIGGGAGGHYTIANARSGGSGAGGSGSSRTAGATGTAGQGNSGGNGVSNEQIGGGGGGAGGPGQNGVGGGTSGKPGDGGPGVSSSIDGSLKFYAGGGAGGRGDGNSFTDNRQRGAGGLGGGGFGGNNSTFPGPGTPNTGGGGGAHGGSHGVVDQSRYGISEGAAGENGGAGIVIIRYPLRQENPVTAAGKTAGDGLVLDLDFAKPTVYSGSGTVVSDSRLNGITGTLNGPTISNQRTHRAEAVYTGNQSITITASGISVTNTSFSIQWWVRKTLVGQPHIQIGGGIYNSISDITPGVSIGTSSNVQSFRAQITDGSVNRRITISPFGFQSNTWTMITYVVNRSNGTAQLYKDSVLVGNLSLGTFGNSTNSNTMTIGGANESAKSIVKFYNIPLSANQVQQEYNATRWRFGV